MRKLLESIGGFILDRFSAPAAGKTAEMSSWEKAFHRAVVLPGTEKDCREPYRNHPWLYRAVRAKATTLAQLPWKLYRKGTEDEVENHWLAGTFNWVNPYMSRYQLWEAIVTWLDLRGEYFVLPWGESRLKPTELWLPDPSRFDPVKNENGQVAQWKYRTKRTQTFELHEVLFQRLFNPYDEIRGLAPLKVLTKSVNVDWRAINYNERFFDQDATPGVVLVASSPVLGDEQRKQILEAWEQRHQGVKNAQRTALLQGGLDVKKVGDTFKDMLYPDLRRMSQEEICGVLGVPLAILSRREGLNRATAWAERQGWWTDTLLPLAKFIEDKWNSDFFPIYAPELEGHFDTSGVAELQEDYGAKVDQGYKLWQMGFPPADINKRLELGMEERPWHGEVFVPWNVQTATDAVSGTARPPAEGEEAKGLLAALLRVLAGGRPALPPPQPPLADDPAHEAPATPRSEPDGIARSAGDLHRELWDALERQFKRKLGKYFFDLRVRQLKRMPEPEARQAAPGDAAWVEQVVFDFGEEGDRLRQVTDPLVAETMGKAGRAVMVEVGAAARFDLADPETGQLLRDSCGKVTGILSTVRERLKASLLEGVEAGESMSVLRDRVRDVMNVASNRALTIARTEVGHAMGGARYQGMRQAGVGRHTWMSAGDPEVRASHRMDGVTVNVGQRFPNGLLYPGDWRNDPTGALTINCRCLTVAAEGPPVPEEPEFVEPPSLLPRLEEFLGDTATQFRTLMHEEWRVNTEFGKDFEKLTSGARVMLIKRLAGGIDRLQTEMKAILRSDYVGAIRFMPAPQYPRAVAYYHMEKRFLGIHPFAWETSSQEWTEYLHHELSHAANTVAMNTPALRPMMLNYWGTSWEISESTPESWWGWARGRKKGATEYEFASNYGWQNMYEDFAEMGRHALTLELRPGLDANCEKTPMLRAKRDLFGRIVGAVTRELLR